MDRDDLKKLLLCGFTLGCLSVAQGAMADEKTQEDVLATTTEKSQENIFVAGCKNGCNQRSAPKNNRALTPEEEQQIQDQGQGQGHSCAGKSQGQDQGQGQGHSCSGRSQPRPYQV